MKFIFVGSKPQSNKTDYGVITATQSKNILISIIDGLSSGSFGYDTLRKIQATIRSIRKSYLEKVSDLKLYCDSGGFSIIKGDVPPSSTGKFIDCYTRYLEEEQDIYNYIFSLDIPINLEYPDFNTKPNIYRFNKESLSKSVEMLNKYPELKNKFIFVWQFKILSQYRIWDQLYNELELGKYVSSFAIGGIVGLRGFLKNFEESEGIDFSPFIALAYRCLYDYYVTRNSNRFKLHILGIYIKHDRFEIILLEKLFQKYLGLDTEVELTYDSVNYMRTAQLKVKNLDINHFENNTIENYPSLLHVPDELFKKVYFDNYYPSILSELELLRSDKNLDNIDAFTPINVYSNISLDIFFNSIIDRYDIVNEIERCTDYSNLATRMKTLFKNLSQHYPKVFTSRLNTCILENIKLTYVFHRWFTKTRTGNQIKDRESLDKLVTAFINKIKYPFDLGD